MSKNRRKGPTPPNPRKAVAVASPSFRVNPIAVVGIGAVIGWIGGLGFAPVTSGVAAGIGTGLAVWLAGAVIMWWERRRTAQALDEG